MLAVGNIANLVSYSDRGNLSLAIVPMSAELGYDKASVGTALGAFYVGYGVNSHSHPLRFHRRAHAPPTLPLSTACTQILGGYLALLYGSVPVLIGGVLLWSAATLLTPAAAGVSLSALVAARVVLGLGEGTCMPCIHALMAEWVPPSERATAATLTSSGQYIGGALALLCAPLAERWWPSVFYRAAHGALPHRAPSPRCTADRVHRVWHR